MMKSQAKRLLAGTVVFWHGEGKESRGVVIRKYYNTVYIQWDDDIGEKTHFAETMDNVFTQEQLDAIKANKKVIAAVAEYKKDQLKRPIVSYDDWRKGQ